MNVQELRRWVNGKKRLFIGRPLPTRGLPLSAEAAALCMLPQHGLKDIVPQWLEDVGNADTTLYLTAKILAGGEIDQFIVALEALVDDAARQAGVERKKDIKPIEWFTEIGRREPRPDIPVVKDAYVGAFPRLRFSPKVRRRFVDLEKCQDVEHLAPTTERKWPNKLVDWPAAVIAGHPIVKEPARDLRIKQNEAEKATPEGVIEKHVPSQAQLRRRMTSPVANETRVNNARKRKRSPEQRYGDARTDEVSSADVSAKRLPVNQQHHISRVPGKPHGDQPETIGKHGSVASVLSY
ncbi:hypothetical protein SAICODRAFT_5830 [Saitoella complicata NRRL Y-17804]|nr:uncharacterized protein SAICODRAFT_5830 [Saitoella complicata NRRL Y-17804]ODQ54628.1 hypothetical protein SAICODRAFT_5830 [Saitoella complicata NRRL Y-17804]